MKILIVIFLCVVYMGVAGCEGSDRKNVGTCPILIWMGGSEEEVTEYFDGIENISSVELLHDGFEGNTKVRIDGNLVLTNQRVYLEPMDTQNSVKTDSARIELKFEKLVGPSAEEMMSAGDVMVVGEVSRANRKWQMVNPMFIRSRYAPSLECVAPKV